MDRDKSFLFSSKCIYLAGFSLIVVLIEIYFIQEWESTDTGFAQTLKSQSYLRRLKMENNCIEPAEPGRNSSTASPCAAPAVAPTTDPPPASKVSKAVQKYLTLRDQLEEHLKKATEKKIILVWVPMFDDTAPISINAKKCGNCEVTFDHDKISDERTGAAVFHFDSIRANDMPTPRNPNQLHIFWGMESSATLKVARRLSLSFEDSYKFNATMTHRLDSAFLASYQSASLADSLMGKNVSIYEDILSKKSKFAIAMISNCGYTNGARVRLTKIKELIRLGLKMDGFGNCFNKKISWKQVSETVAKYKFYFSYENSYHCKDYVTEKFFHNALTNHVVPVVWGATRQDYEKIAPPGSFIFAEDFDTPQKLINYLSLLDKKDEEYVKYFKWLTMKPEMLPQYKRTRGFCAICRALHGINVDERFSPEFDRSNPSVPLFSDGIYPRVVPSLIKWFYGEDNPECFNSGAQHFGGPEFFLILYLSITSVYYPTML